MKRGFIRYLLNKYFYYIFEIIRSRRVISVGVGDNVGLPAPKCCSVEVAFVRSLPARIGYVVIMLKARPRCEGEKIVDFESS